MINAKFVPIQDWPGKATPRNERRKATFRASYQQTLELLEIELEKLDATGVLVQAYIRQKDIRKDGWPMSHVLPDLSGVILTFDTVRAGKRVTLSFPCDTFVDWQDNLRAIAKSLEALRMVDRYGVTSNSEQYKGFTALGAGDPRAAALAFLGKATGWNESQIVNDPRGAHRLAAAALHPDTGGSHDTFIELQRHMEALK